MSAAVADLVADVLNRFTTVSEACPGLVVMEAHLLGWLAGLFGLPQTAGGILTTGGSMGQLSGLLAARQDRLGEEFADGVVYLGDQAHQSAAKAARIIGFPARALRIVPTDDAGRLDIDRLSAEIAADRAAGRRPACIVATAGTTNLGVVDPLAAIAEVAEAEGLWLHVDAAYGGFFQLTRRGRDALAGIERADSIVLDAHKGFFLPFGTGCLLVRDTATLRAAHSFDPAPYLQDIAGTVLPDFADLGPELSRDARGLRLWLPLHLHGVAAFRDCLDEKLDLARRAWVALADEENLQVWSEPELSIVGFRCRAVTAEAGDVATERVIDRVNDDGEVFLSSTVVAGRYMGRIAILNHRTDAARLDEAVAGIRRHAADLSGVG